MREVAYRGSDGCPLFATVQDGEGPLVILLHGGGPDHRSLIPLARHLRDDATVVLPDIRGYGRSVCADPACHTWAGYVDDVLCLLDHLHADRAVVGGAGIGTTISLRFAIAHPERLQASILMSVEEIEDDETKAAEIEFMDAFAARARNEGLEAAWDPILPALAPVIGAMVREAIPRSNAASIAAAAAIGRDRSFRNEQELSAITAPTLIFPGMDARHPAALARRLAELLPYGRLAPGLSSEIRTAEDFGAAFAPEIKRFLADLR